MSVTVHSIFQNASRFVIDAYWKKQLMNMSRNRFPLKMKYDAKNHSVVMNDEAITLPRDTVVLGEFMIELLQKNGLWGPMDLRLGITFGEEETNDVDWKHLKKHQKRRLLKKWIEDNELQESVTDLIKTIDTGYILGTVGVEIEDWVIVGIAEK